MNKKRIKNINQRRLFEKYEKKKIILKSITLNKYLKKNIRWNIQQNFFNYDNNSSITRIKNVCILTNRSKSIYKNLKISRIMLKKLASNSLLPGIFKYSW